MNQKNENELAKRSPLSFELIVRNNQASREKDAPHLILRRKPKEDVQAAGASVTENRDTPPAIDSEIASFESVADYISSLNDHVPDDVVRAVDAIIEEEGEIPSNLPKLDDQLSQIYPGSDVQELSDDDLFYRRENVAPPELISTSYKKKVEYEDL